MDPLESTLAGFGQNYEPLPHWADMLFIWPWQHALQWKLACLVNLHKFFAYFVCESSGLHSSTHVIQLYHPCRNFLPNTMAWMYRQNSLYTVQMVDHMMVHFVMCRFGRVLCQNSLKWYCPNAVTFEVRYFVTYHICNFIFLPSSSIVLILKSMPERDKETCTNIVLN